MKVTVSGTFKGYRSHISPYNIPLNTLTIGSYNTQVVLGEIYSRNHFRINTNIGYNNQRPMGAVAYKNVGTSNEKYRFLVQKADSTTTSTYEVIKFDAGSTASLTSLSPASIGGTYPFKSEFFGDTQYISDGTATPYKYFIDGTTDYFEPQGLPKPSDISSLNYSTDAGASGGFEAGSTEYAYSFVYKVGSDYEWEGPISVTDRTTTSTDSNGRVTMTLTQPLANNAQSHITHYRIYRRHPSQTRLYFVEDVAVGGTGSTDNYIDDDGSVFDVTNPARELNDFDQEIEINSQLTDAHFGIRLHKGVMFYASTDGTTLWFSQPGLPESVKSTNFFTIGGSNDPFTELVSTKEALYIVKKFSIWAITGEDIYSFSVDKVASWGSYLPNMTFSHLGYLYGCNQSGIWRWNGSGEPEIISRQIERDYRYGSSVWPSRQTQTLTARDYDLDGGLSVQELSRYRWTLDKQTGYIWFDAALDDDCMLSSYVYDPSSNSFMGKFTFPHEALTNLQISEGNDFTFCAFQTTTTPVYYWSVYNNLGLGNPNAIFDTDWASENNVVGNVYQAVRFGSYYDEEIKEQITLNYGILHCRTSSTVTLNLVEGHNNTLSQITAGKTLLHTASNKFNLGVSGLGAGILMEQLTSNTGDISVVKFGIDVESQGIW